MRIAAFLLILAGCVVVTLSFIWPLIFPPESRWTEEQAAEHSKAGTHFHSIAMGGHSHTKSRSGSNGKAAAKVSESELAAARRRWEESKAALDAAQVKGKSTAGWLRYGGAAIALVGVAGLVLDKRRPTKADSRPDPFVLLD
ncbi:MAG TPA: hypothetical protein VJ809_04265 [Pirellulales bacterium]|jgi:hypothetical protein|nr:hypothetical protein [Pirellulales bacterium]